MKCWIDASGYVIINDDSKINYFVDVYWYGRRPSSPFQIAITNGNWMVLK